MTLQLKHLKRIIEDCTGFELNNKGLLEKAVKFSNKKYTIDQAGHDLWLTRNGHGAGFWDRGLGDVGELLAIEAQNMGSISLVSGDDGKLYLE
jgi:hypothetical protein